MHHKKFLVSLCVMLCLCANSNVITYAETVVPIVNDEISLAYEIASDPISDLAIVGNTAYCTSSVSGIGDLNITITHTLQRQGFLWLWYDVDSAEWTKTQNDSSVCLSTSKGGLDNGKYRLKSVFTLTNSNGKSETVTIYSDERQIG